MEQVSRIKRENLPQHVILQTPPALLSFFPLLFQFNSMKVNYSECACIAFLFYWGGAGGNLFFSFLWSCCYG